MTIGFYLIILVLLGYMTVYIREKYLNVTWMKPLTYLGILIHESAHAIGCYATGGKVTRMNVSSREGSVEHYEPKIWLLGPIIVSIAPLILGIAIVGLLNYVLLANSISLDSNNIWGNLLVIFNSLNFLTWQTWVLILFFLNIGVIIGPSLQDLRNIVLPVIASFFITSPEFEIILAFAISLVIINLSLFILIWLIKSFFRT